MKVYTLLGFVSELRFSENGQDYMLSFPTKKSWRASKRPAMCMVARSRTDILITPWTCPKKTTPPNKSKAVEIATGWSGYDTTDAFKIDVSKKADKLSSIGYVTRIEYTSDKWIKRGDKRARFNLYRHNFKAAPLLLADDTNNPKHLAIRRRSTLITDRGIIG